MGKRIAIIGAGPAGIEMALAAMEAGHEAVIYERGSVADNIHLWGFVRMFSPWRMNVSSHGARLLEEMGVDLPPEDECPTGREFIESYLEPLTRHDLLHGRIEEGVEVAAIARKHALKHELLGDPERARRPFVLLLQRGPAEEEYAVADVVIDCSGVFGNHRWLGEGGIQAPGEKRIQRFVDYRLRDIRGRDRELFAGKTTAVVGHGYSAATALQDLVELRQSAPDTRIVWLLREDSPSPYPRFANDPLRSRDELAGFANRAAGGGVTGIEVHRGAQVVMVEQGDENNPMVLFVDTPDGEKRIKADRVLGLAGYEPDNSLYRELQVHECYASLGPMKLAAALLAEESAGGGDCLKQGPRTGAELTNPEPGFFILGAKSYGTRSTFLLTVLHQQVEDVLKLIDSLP
ncbi:MAG: hypothetical protein GMKNLPBB_00180 [Myxococcota bacterium]|nr:hypothetical protein [Myxococcota bacterium]